MSALAGTTLLEETLGSNRGVPRAELLPWRERHGLVAGITLRGSGFSLGLWSEEPAGSVLNRWRAFHASFNGAFPRLALGQQSHGSEIARHTQAEAGWLIHEGVDGHATDCAGVLLCVTVADCVPLYLAHPPSGQLALLHAGWRGIAAGIVERGIDSLAAAAGVSSADLILHCGVGICGDCYEVGPEVVAGVMGEAVTAPARMDLRAAVVARARATGMAAVTCSPWCSAHDEAFFSHRRSRGADGRMVAFLGRPLA